MAFRTVPTNTLNNIFLTQQGVDYVLQYDAPTGGVQIIQKNAPSGTFPIYQGGRWNASATQIGLTSQQKNIFHESTQKLIYEAYKAAGGRARGAVLPPFAYPENFNQPAGQTSSVPNKNTSSSNTGTGNGLQSGINAVGSFLAGGSGSGSGSGSGPGNSGGLGSIGNLTAAVGNLPQAASNFAVNGDKFGVGNEKSLFNTTMMYPIDMNVEQQDTLQITGYRYQPSKGTELFGGRASAVDILTKGFQTTSNFSKSQKVGLIILPMPNRVADSNNVNWGEDAMNNLAAAATANMMDTNGMVNTAISAGISKALGAGFGPGVLLKQLADLVGTGSISKELSLLLGPSFASMMLKAGGFGVETESILTRGAGIIPNSNLELLFNGPTLRTFTFTYRLSPREEPEAKRVRRIIRFFKQSMAVKKITGSAGKSSFFLGTPNIFQLEYRTRSTTKGGGQLIDGVNRFKTCALTSFQCDYTPDGFWAAYQAGQPVSTIMSMTFNELEPLYDTDSELIGFKSFLVPSTFS